MCGRVVVDYDENGRVASATEIAEWFSSIPSDWESSWNLKPTQLLPVALTDKNGLKRLERAHWGIIPPWSTDGKAKFTFNARVEGLLDKPTFAPSLKQQRCAVPVNAFYEWTGPKSNRTPHAIFGPQPILPMAGLYRWWQSPDGEWKLTATILTRSATGVMEPLHDRMPVFLNDALIRDWLDPTINGDQQLLDAAAEMSAAVSFELREYSVRPLRGDGPELLTPAA